MRAAYSTPTGFCAPRATPSAYAVRMRSLTTLRFACLPFVLLAACNGQVATEGASGTTSGSTGGGSGSSSTGSSGTSTSSGGAGGSCVGWVDVTVNEATLQFQSNCASDGWNPGMSAAPSGYIWSGGPPPGGTGLNLYGCATEAAGSPGLSLQVPSVTAPGTFAGGTATYTDEGGGVWSSPGTSTVVVTQLGAVGQTIEGTFTATVSNPPADGMEDISGSFSVCHIHDEQAP